MKELRVGLQRRIKNFAEEIKRRVPIEAKSFGEFRYLVDQNGVRKVSAEVCTQYADAHVPFTLNGFVTPDNADATVYVGVASSGRKIVFKEFYDSRSETYPTRAVLRFLVTTEARLSELQALVPDLDVAIKGRGLDMPAIDLANIRNAGDKSSIEPYPRKIDPVFDSLDAFSRRGIYRIPPLNR